MRAADSYFGPEAGSCSLGASNVLRMIEECGRRGLPHLYLGYYVRECGRMSYTAAYRPCEILDDSGRWIPETPEIGQGLDPKRGKHRTSGGTVPGGGQV